MPVVANASAVAVSASCPTTVARRPTQHLRCRAAAAGDARGNQVASAKEVVLSPEDLVRAQCKNKEALDFGDSILGGSSVVEGTAEEMRDLVPFGANNLAVLRATKHYAEAFEAGLDPGQVVANVLGRAPSVLCLFFWCPLAIAHAHTTRARTFRTPITSSLPFPDVRVHLVWLPPRHRGRRSPASCGAVAIASSGAVVITNQWVSKTIRE